MSETTKWGPSRVSWMTVVCTVGLGTLPMAVAQAETLEPAKLRDAALPVTPPLASTGGEVLLELEIDEAGQIAELSVLTDTPPFTSAVVQSVRGWRFRPARGEEGAEASRILVAAYYREPAFYSGTTAGQPPRVEKRGSLEIPYPRPGRGPALPACGLR